MKIWFLSKRHSGLTPFMSISGTDPFNSPLTPALMGDASLLRYRVK